MDTNILLRFADRSHHYARLVAVMKANGASHILTLNVKDFTRYASEGIVPIDPNTISEQ
ncbi:hypothetical protein QT989_13485 [Microcoleus sp. SVA1_B6]|uniref:hypothetical protein n=1 Tax=unclassified Microcoleus TaxID=2642155 RepID=UPI002FD64C2B